MAQSNRQKRLAKARRIRTRIGAEFRRLENGQIALRDVLEDPSETPLRRARIYDVLRRSPHMGKSSAKKILLQEGIWPLDRLGELSKFDRDEILKSLPPRAEQ